MNEHSKAVVAHMRAAFESGDVRLKNVELSRGAHEIERLCGYPNPNEAMDHTDVPSMPSTQSPETTR